MNTLLKRFQDVVEMGKEQDGADVLSDDASAHLTSSSDPAVLRRHIGTLTQQLARQVQSYETLRVESTGIEKELTRLRLRFAASRELWDVANEQLETVIQNLLEHQLYDNTAAAGGGSPGGGVNGNTSSLDTTYVASLHEQIQRLKEMVQRSGEERSQLRSEKQYEQTQLLLRSSGLAGAALDAEVRQALEKMTQHWQEERLQYEATIESLEQHVARHAEREALLSDQVKHEKEQRQSSAETVQQTNTVLLELRAAQAELEEWRSGVRGHVSPSAHAFSASCDPAAAQRTTPDPNSNVSDAYTAAGAASTTNLAAAPSAEQTNISVSTPLARNTPAAASTADVRALLAQQAELELLRQDNGAREEALDSLYADNKHLQEALQRAEAQARQSDVELQACQQELEVVRQQLSREQQRAKRSEEEAHKAAAAESKLREQVRELRQALSAAAAAAEHDALVPTSKSAAACAATVGGLSIPSGRGVRVGLPSRYEAAEQEITYEDGGTWKEWAVEAWRWWKELSGDAVPQRAPLTGSAALGVGRRGGTVAPRRGPRLLLLFAVTMGLVMMMFLLIALLESMYTSLRSS